MKKSRAEYIKGSEDARFWAKVNKTNNCWEWSASLKDGYGVFRTSSQVTVRAHKWLWEKINGPTPKGLELDHLCINRKCVRPDHLEPVTHQENCSRAPVGNRNWRTKVITHCPQGHKYDDENTYLYTRGKTTGRSCKACRAQAGKEWRLKKCASYT